MARPVNAHRRAIIETQKVLKASAKQAGAAGYTLDALLSRAGVERRTWDRWLAGFCLPRPGSLAAIKRAAQELAAAQTHTGFEVAL